MYSTHKTAGRHYSPFYDIALHSNTDSLTDKEINEFFRDIDTDNDGTITFDELKAKLSEVYKELAPETDRQQSRPLERRFTYRRSTPIADLEKGLRRDPEREGLHAFLSAMMPHTDSMMGREEFADLVRSWNVPSQTQTGPETGNGLDGDDETRLTWWRKTRAYWSVFGPKVAFVTFVFCMVLAFFMWQGLRFYFDRNARAALGWGVVVAKFAAGAMYPVIFFLLLSMSRWFSTFMRRFYWISRFVNWDRSQSFHIQMACVLLFFATLHGVGHMAGSFVSGSRPDNQPAVKQLLGQQTPPMTYAMYLALVPGWSGLGALGLFYIIALLSLPPVRRWSYELFQMGHLLMFPFLGLLIIHGAQKLLEYPMLGFWIAGPLLLIIVERCVRLVRGFIRLKATIEVLDKETVNITIKHPKGKNWRYQAGQFVLLQVPELSLWQWHPFTVSVCIGDELQLHIKNSGNWTGQLRELARSRKSDLLVGLDGPFGAPAQRFYDFDRSLIIGSGVGITPFSAILTDLELHLGQWKDPWSHSRAHSRVGSLSSASTAVNSRAGSVASIPGAEHLMRSQTFNQHSSADDLVPSRHRVDFHWMVRERNSLSWFSALLNRVHDLAAGLPRDKLELNITTHITAKRKNISTHVFRYLLDGYRTRSSPVSALTGLKARSSFGRPDLSGILTDFYRDEVARMKLSGTWGQGDKVGVFFCGSPQIGKTLADACAELTARGQADGSKVRFVFMMEVFG